MASQMSPSELQQWLGRRGVWSTRRDKARASIFHLPPTLFHSTPTSLASAGSASSVAEEGKGEAVGGTDERPRGLTCLLCELTFASVVLQHQHFKSQLHGVNLIRSSKRQPILSTTDDLNDDASSDSEESTPSSEESSTELEAIDEVQDLNRANEVRTDAYSIEKVYFPSTGSSYQICMQPFTEWSFNISTTACSCELIAQTDPLTSLAASISRLQANPLIIVLILRSGRFCGVIFNGDVILAHKSIRKYTIRAKSGKAQSSYDNQGSKAQSAGSTLRRYGEQALKDELSVILKAWTPSIVSSAVILCSVPKAMRPVLFDYLPISKDDSRLVFVPYMIDSPTMDSAARMHRVLSSVTFSRISIISPPITSTINIQQISVEETIKSVFESSIDTTIVVEEVFDDEDVNALCFACKQGSFDQMKSVIDRVKTETGESEKNAEGGESQVIPRFLGMFASLDDMSTALHLAAARGDPSMVTYLLGEGAGPSRLDSRGRPPYFVCKNRVTKEAFKEYRGKYESLLDWSSSGVPLPMVLTEQQSEVRASIKKEKEKEKKKRAKQRKKDDKDREEAAEEAVKQEQNRVKREEEEAKARVGVCAQCGRSMVGIKAMDVFDRRCCSSACVVALRRRLAGEAALNRLRT